MQNMLSYLVRPVARTFSIFACSAAMVVGLMPLSSHALKGEIAVVNPQRAILTTDVGAKRVKALQSAKITWHCVNS